MILSTLQISQLRNLTNPIFSLHPAINIIIGPNGSGKTSFLEALFLLSSGHSFRSRDAAPIIAHGQQKMTVFARTEDQQTISIQKSLTAPTIAKINGQTCQSRSELAAFFPSLVFNQDIFQYIDGGPAARRELIDWGLFHVEHGYHDMWKQYQRSLQQRNALLRQKAQPSALAPWNQQLSIYAEQMHACRQRYVRQLKQHFEMLLPQMSIYDCSIEYVKGWDKKNEGLTLEKVLEHAYERDLARQFTSYGAHQADLVLHIESHKAKDFLSRGQKKMILYALKLAQSQTLNTTCAYLIDDIIAELDEVNLTKLQNVIAMSKGQFFITTQYTIAFNNINSQIINL